MAIQPSSPIHRPLALLGSLFNHLIEACFLAREYTKVSSEAVTMALYLALHHRSKSDQSIEALRMMNLPKHLGIVFSEDRKKNTANTNRKEAVESIADIVIWCLRVGIWSLSIYARSGIDEDLQRGIKSSIARKGYAPRLEITTLTTSPEPKRSEEDGNQPSLSIRLLKHDNGQRMLVEIAESWAEIRRYGPPSGDSLTDEVIARRLKDIYGTAPDLIIIFGSRLSGRFPGVVS